MNKLKILYDVVRTMKKKDIITGELKVESVKDGSSIFTLSNSFEKNNQTGRLKARVKMESDYDGKQTKVENSIDSTGIQGCQGHHRFIQHFQHKCFDSKAEGHMGIKGGFEKIAFILGVLSSIKVDEKEDKSAIVTLDLADIPEEIKKSMHEKMQKMHEQTDSQEIGKHFGGHPCMKEFHDMDDKSFKLCVLINKDSEIEKAVLEIAGEKKDEKSVMHNMSFKAELNLA